MNHLTTSQVLQTVDGTADYATQAAVTSHLAVCASCRAEVEFHRSLVRAARRGPLPGLPDRFTKGVMARVILRRQSPFAAWILNNMGSLFAMMAVLGVFWLVMSQPLSFSTSPEKTQGDQIVEQWRQGLSQGYDWLSTSLQPSKTSPAKGESRAVSGDPTKLTLILLSLGALVAIDRLWLSRQRLRPKN